MGIISNIIESLIGPPEEPDPGQQMFGYDYDPTFDEPDPEDYNDDE